MDEIYIGDFVGKTSVADLQRMLDCLDSGAPGAGAEAELLSALRGDPEGLGDYFRLAADMKIAAQAGR